MLSTWFTRSIAHQIPKPKLQYQPKTSRIQTKHSLVHRSVSRLLTTEATEPELANPAIMNIHNMEQKTIVQQSVRSVSYCRCWLSSRFPLCDGSHKQHNAVTGDKVGPVVVQINLPPPESQ